MEDNRGSAAAAGSGLGTRRIGRETGKPGNAAGGRITLRNYLDMSKSLNIEPGSTTAAAAKQQQQQHRLHERARWDMSKSLNADSLLSPSVASTTGGRNPGPAAGNCQQEQVPRSTRNWSSLPNSQRVSNASATDLVQSMKVLPASPNVMDSVQEQQLIDAFVQQLRSIAASSSEQQQQNRRRAVRRSLDFSNDVNPAETMGKPSRPHRKVEVVGPAAAPEPGAPRRSSNRVVVVGDRTPQQQPQQQLQQRKSKQHQHLLPRIEEKQTVISSPISHSHHLSKTTRIKSVDMAPVMQEHAVNCAFELLQSMDKQPSCKLVAWQLKKEFDKVYGPAWHCIVGTSFGSYVTHSVGGFVYFAVGKVSVLLFRTAIEVVPKIVD